MLKYFTGTGAGVRPISMYVQLVIMEFKILMVKYLLFIDNLLMNRATTSQITYQVQAQGRPDNASKRSNEELIILLPIEILIHMMQDWHQN